MSKISVRLERVGRFNAPVYNLVVVKTKQKLNSSFYSKIGLYVPSLKNRFFFVNLKNLSFWLSQGAVVKGHASRLILSLLKFK